MTGSTRTNEKGKAPAYASSIFPNTHPPTGASFLEGNVVEDSFDSILDMPFSIAAWEEIHRSVAQGVPETLRNPRVYSADLNSFQNPLNLSINSANTNTQEVPLLPDWNNAISSGGIHSFGGDLSFAYCPINTAPVHTRNNVNANTNQSGLQGKFEGSFLSLGLGGTSEPVSSSQPDNGGISDKLNEAASNELKKARAWKATSQTFDDAFMCSHINYSGFSNQYSHVSRTTPTNTEFGSHGGLNSGLGSIPHHNLQMQQNGRTEKLIEAPSTDLKMVNARKATGQTLDADFVGFRRNSSGFSDQFSNVNRITSTNHEVGVYGTSLYGGLGSTRQNILPHMQQNDARTIRSGDKDHHKRNQSVHSATLGGNSAHFLNSQQHNLKPPEYVRPSWMTSSYTPSEQLQQFRYTTVNSPNYAGQGISQNATPNQAIGADLYSQRTKTPSWVGTGSAGIDAPFPKRLGVESSVKNSPQSSHGHLSPMGTGMQTTNSGQICQFSDKGSIYMPHNDLIPIGRSDGAPVSYPMSFQESIFTYGQSENALIQHLKGQQGVPSTNVSSVESQPRKLDCHVRPHHKRPAVAPQSASHWIQRQKTIHPTIHHSMPKPPLPVTSAHVHSSIPVRSRTQHTSPVAAHVPPVMPCVSNAKTRVPVASAPAVSHIKWKDPNATSKLSGHKCFLCKRDLALTSEGQVFQPSVPPPIAVLPCGHTFHDQCLQNITPDEQAKDPPCIPCALGEN